MPLAHVSTSSCFGLIPSVFINQRATRMPAPGGPGALCALEQKKFTQKEERGSTRARTGDLQRVKLTS